MEFYKYVGILVFGSIIYGHRTNSSAECGNSITCFCTRSLHDTKFQCPDDITPKIIINVKNNGIEIRCMETLDWHYHDLPNLNMEITDYIKFHQCPFPTNLVEVINILKVNKTKELRFNDHKKLPHFQLSAAYFKDLTNLERLILNSSNINDIDEDAFKSLDTLIELYIDYNHIQLKDGMFKNLSNLKVLSLTYNEILELPRFIFKKVGKLEKLNLKYNKIKDLFHEIFSPLEQLETLNLENNLITNIQSTTFRNLKSLEKLNLRNNKIKFLDIYSFRMLYNLKEAVLSNNVFDLPKSDIPNLSLFSNNNELEKLDLSNNSITVMDDFNLNYKLEELDLSYNQISYLHFDHIFIAASTININLIHNSIRTIDFKDVNFDEYVSNKGNRRISLNGNPINCNCYLYDFVRYLDHRIHSAISQLLTFEVDQLTCSSPKDLFNVPVTKLNLDWLTCSLSELGLENRFTDGCLYSFQPLDKSLIINCTNANYTIPPKLILPMQNIFNQTVVYLENNLLSSGPKKNTGYENVTKLFLSSNNINEITWLPPKLQVLELHNNNISYLNYEILTKLNFSTLNHITLGKNPWNCNCFLVNLTTFVVSSMAKKHIDANFIKCEDGRKIMDLNLDDLCPSNLTLALQLGIIFTLTALLIAIVVALYYCFQQEVKVWLFANNFWFITEDEIDKDKLYDAFVSYSHKDENFVLNDLLPVLEEGPRQYKVCVHIRDWIAGEFISKQIATSVMESRRTIVILSRNFLDSEWGKMEFRTAHKQAIHEGRARVILILYGDIDINSDLDDDLRAYVRTNTYLKWGDPWFWDKLRYALPHTRDNTIKQLLETKISRMKIKNSIV